MPDDRRRCRDEKNPSIVEAGVTEFPTAAKPTLAVVDAVEALDPQARTHRWSSLTYCIVDAVWSIGARYDAVVVPLVRRIAEQVADSTPLVRAGGELPADHLPVERFLSRYSDASALQAVTNAQRTSTRSGITKADAALRYARVFAEHRVSDLATAASLAADSPALWDHLDQALTQVPGDGQSGIRRGYLWMLIGHDNVVKPDRLVLRWLAHHGASVTADQARVMLAEVAATLSARLHRPVTRWMVDRAIWRAAQTRQGDS